MLVTLGISFKNGKYIMSKVLLHCGIFGITVGLLSLYFSINDFINIISLICLLFGLILFTFYFITKDLF
jgi:hypothetical protein